MSKGLEDVEDFDHEVLKSMGVESAKHRLVLLKWCKAKAKSALEQEQKAAKKKEKEATIKQGKAKSKETAVVEEKEKSKRKRKGSAKPAKPTKAPAQAQATNEEGGESGALAFGSELVYAGPEEMEDEDFQELDLDSSMASLARKVCACRVVSCAIADSSVHVLCRTGRPPTTARRACSTCSTPPDRRSTAACAIRYPELAPPRACRA